MKVLNLQCGEQHLFEGWFASEVDFQSQLERGLLTCPMCDNRDVRKLLSAPRLNLSGAKFLREAGRALTETCPVSESSDIAPLASKNQVTDSDAGAGAGAGAGTGTGTTGTGGNADDLRPAQAALLMAVRHLLKNSEDVGDRFAREARRMHEGDSHQRSIRGQASARDAEALREEGISVMSFPLPAVLKGTLQ